MTSDMPIGRSVSGVGNHRGGSASPPPDRGREDELLDRARGGDVAAFSAIVVRYQDAVYGLVQRAVRDAEVAREITQDAFVKAHRNLAGFRGDAKLSTWLYRIAVNLCHDYRGSLVARMRRDETSIDDPDGFLPDLPSGVVGPDDVVAGRQVADAFARALDALDPTYRDAFLLRHQEDLGYDEISEILGISRTNAKVRVHRAREMILAILRRQGHEV